MSKKPRVAEAAALPSREELIAFITRERSTAAKIGKRDIARAFNLRGDTKIGLKRMLRDLEAEGAIAQTRKSLHKAGALPPSLVVEIYSRDRDGDLLAKPVDWVADEPAPTIVLPASSRRRTNAPAPGLGDRALIRMEVGGSDRRGRVLPVGRIVKVLARTRSEVLGIFKAGRLGQGDQVFSVDKKTANKGPLLIPPDMTGDAEDGDLVSVEVLGSTRAGRATARVVERVGPGASEKAASLIAIHAHKIPNVFSPSALAEAAAASNVALAGREDWREMPLVTIDPVDAKDHDDAVHAESDPDPANAGGFILAVAIADVAAYVRPRSALDHDALERGNSVYFPDRVVPMLPERISNDLCSLRPDEDRAALAIRMVIDAKGEKRSHSLHRILMRSHAKLAYQRAQAAIDGAPDAVASSLLDNVLRPLWAAYGALVLARAKRQPLELDLPERKLVLDATGHVEKVLTPTRLDAHRLIEEFMVLANVAAAELLEAKQQVLIYRAHGEPSIEKLHNLGEFLRTIDIKLAKGQVVSPSQFNGILSRVRGTEHEQIVNDVVLRTQAQAEYTNDNYGHFGLHLRRYAHFTSPIRRYADLVVHRALIRAYKLGDDGLADDQKGELAEVADRISRAERRAMAAERETNDRLIAAFLADKVGASFSGRIAGVTRAGLFVKLADTGADGFIPAATLGDEYFRYEEAMHALVGSRSGEILRLGDLVDVVLAEAAPFAGALRFDLVREGRKVSPSHRRSSSSGFSRRRAPGARERV